MLRWDVCYIDDYSKHSGPKLMIMCCGENGALIVRVLLITKYLLYTTCTAALIPCTLYYFSWSQLSLTLMLNYING